MSWRLPFVFVLPLCAGCVQFSWSRESRHAPVPSASIDALRAHETELGDCLAAFGAPLWVWEDVQDGQASAVLAYGWFDELSLGWRVSVNVYRGASASVDYDNIDQRMHGLVLFFDPEWKLASWRVGLLRDLTQAVRRPPPALAEDA